MTGRVRPGFAVGVPHAFLSRPTVAAALPA